MILDAPADDRTMDDKHSLFNHAALSNLRANRQTFTARQNRAALVSTWPIGRKHSTRGALVSWLRTNFTRTDAHIL